MHDSRQTLMFDNSPKEISITLNGSTITAEQVFQLLYSRLDEAIEQNRVRLFSKAKTERLGREGSLVSIDKAKKKAIYEQWFRGEAEGLEATVTFDDATKEEYFVSRREDFDLDTMVKSPSVAFLINKDDGSTMILREARRYPLEELIFPACTRVIPRRLDEESTKQFYSKEDCPASLPRNNSLAVYIPEPQLLCALEAMYATEVLRRFTPQIYLIDNKEGHMWYLRRFVEKSVDFGGAKAKDLGKYFGRIHALGLMEILDRQIEHYCYIQGNVGNYDPDFMLFTQSDNMINHREWRDIKNTIDVSASGVIADKDVRKIYLNEIRKTLNKTREDLRTNQGIWPETLFRYLHTQIHPDHVLRLEVK